MSLANRYGQPMSADPRAALATFVAALERHLELAASRKDAEDPAVGAAAEAVVEAFDDYDEALFERLRAWRLARSAEDSVPAFVVFTDATLQLIAEHVPTDEKGLRAISGVGPSKIAKYGDEVLALVAGASP